MRRTLIFSVLIGGAALASSSAFAVGNMNSATCQPLSGTNLEACCATTDWRDIILPGDHRYCPPLNSSDINSGRLGAVIPGDGNVVPVPGEEVPDPVTTGSIGANPGNVNPVGGAGEKDKDNENPVSGTKGDSN